MALSEPDDKLKAPNSAPDIRPAPNWSIWTHRQGRAGDKKWFGPRPLAARSSHHLTAALPSRTARFQVKAFELVLPPAGVGRLETPIPRSVTPRL
jgi:hypothetical protein